MNNQLADLLKTTETNMTEIVRTTLGRQRTPEQFNILMTHVLAAMDMFCEQLDQMMSPTQQLACRRGCGLCCSNIKVITQPYFAIYAYLQAKTDQSVFDKALTEMKNGSANCYFLHDNVCSNYAVRPSPCRTFHSFDLENCKEGNFLRTGRASNYALAFIDSGLKKGFSELGIECEDVVFNQALSLLMRDDSLFQHWLEGEATFTSAYL